MFMLYLAPNQPSVHGTRLRSVLASMCVIILRITRIKPLILRRIWRQVIGTGGWNDIRSPFFTGKVVDGDHWMLDFGDKQAEANKALSVIKKYGFTHICFVGRPDAPMMYFRKDKGLQTLPVKIPGKVIGPLQPSSYITAELVVQPDDYTGKYPVTIRFKGKIKSDRACEVEYTFTRSDGATGPVKKLKFKGPGAKNVGTSWTLSTDYTGWQTVKILSPVEVESVKAQFTIKQFKLLKPKPILKPGP